MSLKVYSRGGGEPKLNIRAKVYSVWYRLILKLSFHMHVVEYRIKRLKGNQKVVCSSLMYGNVYQNAELSGV